MIQSFPSRRGKSMTAGQRVFVLAICAVFLLIYASPKYARSLITRPHCWPSDCIAGVFS